MNDSFETVKEVAKDVKDAVGEMIEQGIQSVSGPTLTPQQVQQKQQQDQKELVRVRTWFKNLEQETAKVRQANQQKEQQRLQSQQQEKQVTRAKIEEKKKQPVNPVVAYAGKAEFKRGVGG